MRYLAAVAVVFAGFGPVGASAESCPGRPDALGTARVLTLDPEARGRIGSMQYPETLPLAHNEVVLTFDDGPLPAYTSQILQILASECVKATFFMVGRMMRAYPEWVRRVYNAGHSVATHSDRHPARFDLLDLGVSIDEVERGIAAAEAALGDRRALSPFFRFPGLRRSAALEGYLASRGIAVWSADVPGDDWRPIAAETVTARVIKRLARKGRGIVLLHDIQPRTVLALPGLLRELKARGYRIVHVVPATQARPPTVAEPAAVAVRRQRRGVWPKVAWVAAARPAELPVPSTLSFGFPDVFAETIEIGTIDQATSPMRLARAVLGLPGARRGKGVAAVWPHPGAMTAAQTAANAVPSSQSLDLSQPLGSHLAVHLETEADRGRPRRKATRPRPSPPASGRQQASASEVRLRGRIDETGERNWSQGLFWFQ